MIKMSDVVARLEPLKLSGKLKDVGGIGSMPELLDQLKAFPVAFIMPMSQLATPNEVSTGVIRQTVTTHIPVMIAFQHIGNRFGDLTKDVEDTINAVEDQLLGWTPDSIEQSPCELLSSLTLDSDPKLGTLLYGITFSSRNHKRKT